MTEHKPITHHCSFCGKNNNEVAAIFVGYSSDTCICDECVVFIMQIAMGSAKRQDGKKIETHDQLLTGHEKSVLWNYLDDTYKIHAVADEERKIIIEIMNKIAGVGQ